MLFDEVKFYSVTMKQFDFFQVEMEGLTGRIKFDPRGFRSDFDLEIIELKKEGLYRYV